MKYKHTQGGFSILFASLIGSLVLAIGLAILSITLKQITLASSGRESQRAFYAADTGTEFAMFLDRGGEYPEECPNGIFPIPGDGSGTICGIDSLPFVFDGVTLNDNDGTLGQNGNLTVIESTSSYHITQISVKRDVYTSNPICFDVFITKSLAADGIGVKTKIESRGYNTCNEDSENRFERAILTTY